MLAKAIIRKIMEDTDIGMTRMANMLGYKRPTLIGDRLSVGKSTNLSTDTMDEMVRALGYKVIIVPESVEMETGWYEVDDSKHAEIPEKRKAGRRPSKNSEKAKKDIDK